MMLRFASAPTVSTYRTASPVHAIKLLRQPVRARGAAYPGPQEEKEVSHSAFLHAVDEAAHAPFERIPGLQEFASAIWERRRRIPASVYNDPLDHIFYEFDADGDGHLTAAEVVEALKSRGVIATAAQIQKYIDEIDTNGNHTVERNEFAPFIFHLASTELKSFASMHSVDDNSVHSVPR